MQKNSESGKVARTRSRENAVRNMAQTFVGSPDVAVGLMDRLISGVGWIQVD